MCVVNTDLDVNKGRKDYTSKPFLKIASQMVLMLNTKVEESTGYSKMSVGWEFTCSGFTDFMFMYVPVLVSVTPGLAG